MALILKKCSKDSKGVIIFTHKEFANFFYGNKDYLRRIYHGLKLSLKDTFYKAFKDDLFSKSIIELKQNYYIGVHFGWFARSVNYLDYADFILSSENNLPDLKFSGPILNLVSRNFIPKNFECMPTSNRFYDIINVSRNLKEKNLDLFLQTVREIYDKKKLLRVLLVVASDPGEQTKPERFYTDLLKNYYDLFSATEREYFTLMKFSPEVRFPGIPADTISFLMKNSKVLTLFSKLEGSSKVISESLLSGCKVCAYEKLEGGGLDYLNEQNSVLFKNFESASEALISAVESGPMSMEEYKRIHSLNSYDHSLTRLLSFITSNFYKNNIKNLNFINLDQLNRRLPAHNNDETIPWNLSQFGTSDILTSDQLKIFMNYV